MNYHDVKLRLVVDEFIQNQTGNSVCKKNHGPLPRDITNWQFSSEMLVCLTLFIFHLFTLQRLLGRHILLCMTILLQKYEHKIVAKYYYKLFSRVIVSKHCANNGNHRYIMICKLEAHYHDVIMGAMASQITSLMIIYPIVYSDADQRKHQSSASLVFVRGIHRGPVNSPHKWPVTRKMFPFDDVIKLCRRMFASHFVMHTPPPAWHQLRELASRHILI